MNNGAKGLEMNGASSQAAEPGTIERPTIDPSLQPAEPPSTAYRVILYNDEWHGMDEVVVQVRKATGYRMQRVLEIVLEAHHTGRAVCYHGSREDCHRVARVLREIRLQVEVDCD